VADEKNKEVAEGDGKKKGGMMPLVLVAVGAIAGGAGAVFATPKPEPIVVHTPPPQIVERDIEDVMSFVFNPQTKAGRAAVSCEFTFTYQVLEDRENEAVDLMEKNWKRAYSNVLLLLAATSNEELRTPSGKVDLARSIAAELEVSFFPGPEDNRVAKITDVLWEKWIVQ
jgi:flagellar basal body-associated protein FliL